MEDRYFDLNGETEQKAFSEFNVGSTKSCTESSPEYTIVGLKLNNVELCALI
jgi:hypothetical protein